MGPGSRGSRRVMSRSSRALHVPTLNLGSNGARMRTGTVKQVNLGAWHGPSMTAAVTTVVSVGGAEVLNAPSRSVGLLRVCIQATEGIGRYVCVCVTSLSTLSHPVSSVGDRFVTGSRPEGGTDSLNEPENAGNQNLSGIRRKITGTPVIALRRQHQQPFCHLDEPRAPVSASRRAPTAPGASLLKEKRPASTRPRCLRLAPCQTEY